MLMSDWISDVCSSDLDALRPLYRLFYGGKIEGCSHGAFEAATGLSLSDSNGLKAELPPITTFLTRMLALSTDRQNILFTSFEALLTARFEGATRAGRPEEHSQGNG